MLTKNWAEILKLECVYLRLAIVLATDEVLKCFKRGFQHLFKEVAEENEIDITNPVPLSLVREVTVKHLTEETDVEPDVIKFHVAVAMWEGFAQLNRKYYSMFLKFSEWPAEGDEMTMPDDLCEQLRKTRIDYKNGPIILEWRGQNLMVVSLLLDKKKKETIIRAADRLYPVPDGYSITDEDEIDQLWLIDTRFVDLNH